MLKEFSNNELLNNFRRLVEKEGDTTLEVLYYLGELDERKLYLAEGYTSLFDFCVRGIKYSEGAAMRRIKSARLIRDYPEVKALLKERKISLSTISLVAGIINQENKDKILSGVSSKSKKEIAVFLLQFKELVNIKPLEKVTPILVNESSREVKEKSYPLFNQAPKSDGTKNLIISTATGGGKDQVVADSETKPAEPQEESYKLQFTVSKKTMNRINRAKELLSGKFPKGAGLHEIFDVLLEDYLERRDPTREKATEESLKNTLNNVESAQFAQSREGLGSKSSRYVPKIIRNEVYLRDQGKCSYVSPNGVRCNSVWDLEVDHIKPFGKGGDNNPKNLRLLCRGHNHLMSERQFGKEHVRKSALNCAEKIQE